MNWEAIGAIAELFGALGVIVTVGYLAVQIRQNSKLIASSLAESTTARPHGSSGPASRAGLRSPIRKSNSSTLC